MTSDLPEPDAWDQELADARRRVENCRESITNAMEAAARDPRVAKSFARYAKKKQLEMIIAARQVHDLGLRAPSRSGPTPDELREHELRLGLPPGTFSRCVYDPGPAEAVELGRALELAEELAEAQLGADDPPEVGPDYLPAIIRICCATVVGALIGAPLGALAVEENILKKMYEAAIVTGLASIAAEIAGPLSEMAKHQPQAEPAPEVRDSATTERLHPEVARSALPEPPEPELSELEVPEPKPVAAEPVAPESVEAEPVEPEPVEPEPVEPVEPEPVEPESAEAESVEPEPVEAESVEAESVEAESVEAESVEPEPVEAEPVEPEPTEPEPVEREPEEPEPFLEF
jgi:hypothetical protein